MGGLFLFFLILGLVLPKSDKKATAADIQTATPTATFSTAEPTPSTPAPVATQVAATTPAAGLLAPATTSAAAPAQRTTQPAVPAATQPARTEPAQAAAPPQQQAPPPQQQAPPPQQAPAQPASVYYANCSEARAAGAAPLHRGDPGYRSALDRDDDGVACETS
ncbi:excalibur calcium-binding domain-containing protein [Pseudofrankia saprophytica]